MSTVLAYYYSSESVEAAAKSVKQLMSSEEKLNSTLVADKMIKFEDMTVFTYDDKIKIQDLLDQLKQSGKGSRLPFIGKNKQPEYMLHKSIIDEGLLELTRQQVDITKVTLKELFEKVPNVKITAQNSFIAVSKNATLSEAKNEMQKNKNAQDVFVTDNGKKSGTLVGWITNQIIEQTSIV